MSNDTKNSVADIYTLTQSRRHFYDKSTFVTGFPVPLGLYQSFSGSIAGGDHTLNFTMSPNLIQSMVETNDVAGNTGRSTAGLSIVCTDIVLMAAFASPQESIPVSPVALIPVTEINTQTASHNVNGSGSFSLTVPASTKKILVGSAYADQSAFTADGATGFGGAQPSIGPQVFYAGQTSPVTQYNSADANNDHRKYMDFYLNSLMSGRSTYDELAAWQGDPLTAHYFAKSPQSLDTNAIVKLTANGSSLHSSIVVGAVHDAMIALSYDSSGQITSVNYNIVS